MDRVKPSWCRYQRFDGEHARLLEAQKARASGLDAIEGTGEFLHSGPGKCSSIGATWFATSGSREGARGKYVQDASAVGLRQTNTWVVHLLRWVVMVCISTSGFCWSL